MGTARFDGVRDLERQRTRQLWARKVEADHQDDQ
jgi:hypothetical protein